MNLRKNLDTTRFLDGHPRSSLDNRNTFEEESIMKVQEKMKTYGKLLF